MSTSIKKLNEVMRNPKTYSQTKALYSYLWVRADYKSGLSYPPKEQILKEVNLTETLYNQCLNVLKSYQYIRETTKEMTDKNNKKYKIKVFDLNDYDNTTPKQQQLKL
jgi:hypothetical protein